MINKIKIALVFFLMSIVVDGQQLFNYSQSLIAPGLQNPAFARFNDELHFSLIRKSAFGSIQGAPVDNSFYFSTPLNDKNGIGVFINQNTQGIFQELNASLQYGRSINITEYMKLGFGVGAGVKNQTINLDEVIAFDENDPFLLAGINQSTTYDASFGMYLSSSRLLFRVALPQLLGNRYVADYGKLNQHMLSNVQYKFFLKNNLLLEPSIGFDYTVNAPISYNVGFLVYYKRVFWVGAQYKSNYALSPMAGLNYKKFSLGYSYDFSQINYSGLGMGHEILLQVKIRRKVNKREHISADEAEDRIFELIDEYFDVQNSDIDFLDKWILMKKIKKEINELLPFLRKEKKQQIKNRINN